MAMRPALVIMISKQGRGDISAAVGISSCIFAFPKGQITEVSSYLNLAI